MNKITALRTGKGRAKRVKLYLDGELALNLEPEVAAEENLEVAQSLSDERLRTLKEANEVRRAYNAAIRFIAYRARSEPEVRQRLKKRGFETGAIETVIQKLKRQKLVDDTSFARLWTENRQSFSPRSRRLIRLELKQKGLSEEVIDTAVTDMDEDEAAWQAAQKKLRSLSGTDFQTFRRKLGDHLRRRGFGYEVISGVVNRAWQEKQSAEN